tara:strand:- start:111 stop:563 length:453 start_codon:yes stop_codon:yes gene_type:complete
MKKLIYLFLTVLIVACSDGEEILEGGNSGSNLSIDGKWNFISITSCGDPQYASDCELESYLLLDNGDGLGIFYNDNDNGAEIPCQIVNNLEFTYIAVPNTNTYNFIRDDGVIVGTVNGNTLSFIRERSASGSECEQQEGTITEITVYIKE